MTALGCNDAHNWGHLRVVKGYRILRCSRCSVLATEALIRRRRKPEYDAEHAVRTDYIRQALPAKHATWRKCWPILERFRTTGRLYDVGCGHGFFVQEALAHGWEAFGCDPGAYESGIGRRGRVMTGGTDALPGELADVVTLWDVIEHVYDPHALICEAASKLRIGGALVVRTPNGEALELRARSPLGKLLIQGHIQLVYPANPAEHVFHFRPVDLRNILNDVGLAPVDEELATDGEEVISSGRNIAVTAAKRFFARTSIGRQWPYEMTFVAEKRTTTP